MGEARRAQVHEQRGLAHGRQSKGQGRAVLAGRRGRQAATGRTRWVVAGVHIHVGQVACGQDRARQQQAHSWAPMQASASCRKATAPLAGKPLLSACTRALGAPMSTSLHDRPVLPSCTPGSHSTVPCMPKCSTALAPKSSCGGRVGCGWAEAARGRGAGVVLGPQAAQQGSPGAPPALPRAPASPPAWTARPTPRHPPSSRPRAAPAASGRRRRTAGAA